MIHFGAVLLDVVTKLGGNLAVAFQQVFTGHAFLAGSTTGRNDILGTGESLFGINGVGDIGTGEGALLNLVEDTVYSRLENVVKANVGSETEHEGALHHVGTNHTAGTDDDQFFIS